MRRRHRLLAALLLVGSGVAATATLTALSAGAEGPLTATFRRLGAATGSLEHRLRERLTGPGRSARLAWFAAHREDTAWLRRPDRVLLGAWDGDAPRTFDGVVRLERALDVTLPLVQVYTAWGDRPDQQFPLELVTAIRDLGSLPLVTWEPWLSAFDSRRHPQLPLPQERDRHGLAMVAGGHYDFYIDAWAAEAARWGHPILVRFGHEMNDPYRYPWGPQHNTKEEFIAAWRHVVERVRAAGATNVLWVWSPHVAYEYWELYYPGDAWVDWVATGALNYGPIAQWSQWWTFDEIFGRKYPALASFGKPVMVAEFGTLAVGGDQAAWYRDALARLPARYPAVRALLFFHAGADHTVTYQTVDWRVTEDSTVSGAIRDALAPWAPGVADGR